jgi:hypothetical protein
MSSDLSVDLQLGHVQRSIRKAAGGTHDHRRRVVMMASGLGALALTVYGRRNAFPARL